MDNKQENIEKHKAARPMVVLKDKGGKNWLCDKGVNPEYDLEKQGCWKCGDDHFAFTRDD